MLKEPHPSHFEVQVSDSCGADGRVVPNRLLVNHWQEARHQRVDGTYEASRANSLDARGLHATVADGYERVFVLAQDTTLPGSWLVVASIDVENGRLREGALDNVVGSRVEAVLAQCNAVARRAVP